MAERGEDLVTLYDRAPLNARYWLTIALCIFSSVFDYFDYHIVGVLVAVLAPQWHLTFGQTSIMLLSAGAVYMVPDGAWIVFATLRFFVGFGVGAAASVAVPLIVEYTPTRNRTVVTSATVIPVSLGVLAASLTAATMLQS